MSQEEFKKDRPNPDKEEEVWASIAKRLEKMVPTIVKRTVLAGVGTVFMTEEGIRSLLSDIPLPKEIVVFLVQQANTTKKELFRVIAKEMRDFLESVNLGEELVKALTAVAFQIKMEVKLVPNDEGFVSAKVKAEAEKKSTREE